MRSTHSLRLFLVVCLSCPFCQSINAQKNLLYPNLEKGRYDIGYKTIIDFDYSRTYNLNYPNDTSSRKRDPRPIIINIWYPATTGAKDKSLLYKDYIEVKSQDATLKTFLERIGNYNRNNSVRYMFYTDSLTSEQQRQFANQLKLPVRGFRDASPVDEKFPLVIYHAGLGGTLNDNTVLCEYLASHGFVVVTGAFQDSDYTGVSLDWDLERSTKDIDFMLNRIKDFQFIDFSKIAAIGHSYGAQAVLAYRTEDFSPVSWLIIIDSTIDYSIDANPEGFEPLTARLYGKIRNMNVPMLVFANTNAEFKVLDSLKYADRMYCTLRLEHNDFTSLTSLAKQNGLLRQNEQDSVWHKYTLMVDYCLNYLKYHMFGDESAKQFVSSKHPFTTTYEIARGSQLSTRIPDYSDYSQPPTFYQFRKLVAAKRIQTLDTVFALYPDAVSEDVINNTGYGVLKKDLDYSIYFFRKNVELHPESFNVWDSLGEGYMVKGERELAINHYRKSIELNPDNENGLRMLEKLKGNQ